MADSEARGAEFEKKADKKLGGWSVFGGKYDDAADLLEKAANSYKLAKSCKQFVRVFVCDSFFFPSL
jgi:alpha-soluble NSF attachment protein